MRLRLGPIAFLVLGLVVTGLTFAACYLAASGPGTGYDDADTCSVVPHGIGSGVIAVLSGVALWLRSTWSTAVPVMAVGFLNGHVAFFVLLALAVEVAPKAISFGPVPHIVTILLIYLVSMVPLGAAAAAARAGASTVLGFVEPDEEDAEATYLSGLAKLLARIMNVDDGLLNREEKRFFTRAIQRHTKERWATPLLLRHADASMEDRSVLVRRTLEAARRLGQRDPEERLLELLARAAEADGPVNEEERIFLVQVAREAGWDRSRTEAWLENRGRNAP